MTKPVWSIAALVFLLCQGALGARVEPISKLEQLPEQEDEASLWEIASEHENNLRNSGRLMKNRQLESYLESLAERMLGNELDHLGITLDFLIVEEATLSAWVYPYGTIAVHTGLLARMDNEAQLVAIIAHETSHFLQRHSYKELIKEGRSKSVGKGLGFLAALAVASQTGTLDTGIMDKTGGIWSNLVTSGYSQKNEYVADEEGLMLMARAGLSRDEAMPAFAALAENEVYGAGDPRKLWSSHPKLEDRLKNLDKEIEKEKKNANKKSRRKKKEPDAPYDPGVVPESAAYYQAIAPALIANARLDIGERQFERAREALTKYLSVRPDDPEAHFLVGETYRRATPRGPDYSQRIAAYQQALVHDSGFAQAHKELGMAYRVQQQNAEARQAFQEFLALAEASPEAGIVKGYLETL